MTASTGYFAARKSMLEQGKQSCSSCGLVKSLEDFCVSRAAYSGRKAACKSCDRARDKRTRADYRASRAAKARRWRKVPQNALHHRMSVALSRSIRCNKMGKSTFEIVGYTRAELIEHLERQFTAGMSWSNMGKWHIDHIVPKASFDVSIPGELKRCWALTNLRPLWAKENLRKRDARTHLL